MKKITFLLAMFVMAFGYAQTPTDNATAPPARDAADVISISSSDYADLAGTDFNPNWGQSGFGTADAAFDPGTGNTVLAYPNFNYQGTQYATQNIAEMEFLHVDIWINNAFNPNVFVISSGGEIAHPITNAGAGTWTSVDIPVAGITGDLAAAFQFKFDGGNGGTDAIFVDNIYFWKTPTAVGTDASLSDLQVDGATINGFGPGTTSYSVDLAPGTVAVPQITTATSTDPAATSVTINQAPALPGDATVVVVSQDGSVTETYTVSFAIVGPPTAASTPPNRLAADVFSVYSNAYAAEASTLGAFGGGTVTDFNIGGDDFLRLSGAPGSNLQWFFGIPDGVDLSGFTHFHMDYYFDGSVPGEGAIFQTIMQGFDASSNFTGNSLHNEIPTVTGQWISLDIPISSFNGGVSVRDNIGQMQLAMAGPAFGPTYVDNVYFHKNTLSTAQFELENVSVYPNPTNGIWNIKANNLNIETVQVFDILGKQVMTLAPNASEVSIDASGLNEGIYLVKMTSANGTKTMKLVKN